MIQPITMMLPMMKAGRRISRRNVSRRAWDRSETARCWRSGAIGAGRDR